MNAKNKTIVHDLWHQWNTKVLMGCKTTSSIRSHHRIKSNCTTSDLDIHNQWFSLTYSFRMNIVIHDYGFSCQFSLRLRTFQKSIIWTSSCNNLITGIKYYSEMKRLINFLIINTMIGIGHISSNDKCHDLVLLNNQCLLTLPGAGETTSPLHVW